MTLQITTASPGLVWIVLSDVYTCSLNRGTMFTLIHANGKYRCIGLTVCNTAMELNITSGEGSSANLSAAPVAPYSYRHTHK